LKELFNRLDSKYSNQNTWNEYVKLIGMLLKQCVKEPSDADDINSPLRTKMANELPKRLARISEATSKLRAVFTADEQKTLHLLNFEWVKLYCKMLMQY
jgi:hypothetical protein